MTYRLDTTQGVFVGQTERVDALNDRIFARNLAPGGAFTPLYDIRPVGTKYTHFGLGTPAPAPIDAARAGRDHDLEALWRGEAMLARTDADAYIPARASDLYNTKIPRGSITDAQPWPLLAPDTAGFAANARMRNTRGTDIGAQTFNNFTQSQMRSM
jgi:hypothetical protein